MAKNSPDNELNPTKLLAAIRKRGQRGLTVQQLVNHLAAERRLGRSEARRLLRPALKSLQRDGQVVLGRGKRYFVPEASNLVTGRLRRAAGATVEVVVEGTHDAPVRVPPQSLRGALEGDTVLARLEKPRKRARADGVREGVVVRVLERARREVLGRWVVSSGRPHVRPLERKLRFTVAPTGSRFEGEPDEGELVVISIDSVDGRGRNARGVLLERLGQPTDPGVVERAVLRAHGVPVEFAEEVLAEAEMLPKEISDREIGRREDLRSEPAITIDGRTARDFDDAVSARPGKNDSIEVAVHIADVSHYVRPGSSLDAAARLRGTSVYLPGLCVPMLPERLSNDLCSLREAEDRLTWTAWFSVTPDGKLMDRRAAPSVICSRRRCTYIEVAEWLDFRQRTASDRGGASRGVWISISPSPSCF
jgi:ribonuclease R